MVRLRQYNSNGRGIDCSVWLSPKSYDLHILMYDVHLKGCVRFEVDDYPF